MGKYSINAYKLDEVCDLLDEYDIPGNVLGETLAGEPFVKIWKGTYERLQERDFCESDILFKIYWWPLTEKYALHVLDKECAEQIKSLWQSECGMPNIYLFKTPRAMIDTIKMLFSHKEKTDMNEFTLATYLFDKLKKNHIRYKFINGVYNPKEIIITTNTNHDICRVRSISDSESSEYSYEAYWSTVACRNINRITSYGTSDMLIKDILSVEREIEYTSIAADALATYGLITPFIKEKFAIKDVIFNDPATIVFWNDGTKTVVQAVNEPFDPEKGLAMAICRKAFGNKHDYYNVFKKYVGRYEKRQKKAVKNDG